VFTDFYAAKGWLVGKSPMKDWRAAVRTWKQRDRQRLEPPTESPEESHRRAEETVKRLESKGQL
jgi:hypothetical protein